MEVDGAATGVDTDALLRAAFERTPVGMSFVTPDRRPLLINPALSAMLGYSAEEIRGLSISEFTHPDDLFNHVELHDELLVGQRNWYRVDKRYRHKDGHTVWAMLHVAGVYDESGQLQVLVSQVHDMSDEVHERERASWRATHDQLTRVLDRQRFSEQLDERLRRSAARVAHPALLVVDVDDLHQLNEADGYPAGDELLRSLAAGLTASVPSGGLVGRLDGDRFGVLLEDAGSPEEALALAAEIGARLADELRRFSFTTVSIGVARRSRDDAAGLMIRAEAALRQAKRAGKNRTVLAD